MQRPQRGLKIPPAFLLLHSIHGHAIKYAMTIPALEKKIAATGLTYGRRRDVSYRAGLVAQVLGAALLAVLYPLENPFYTAGIMLFEAGVLLSTVSALISPSWINKAVFVAAVAGISFQAAGFYAPEENAGLIILGGLGLVCAAAAGMAGKEAYYFGYWDGWTLSAIGFPLMVVANLAARENRMFNAVGFSALFLLLLSLAGRKLKQPLPSSCPSKTCPPPLQ